MQAPRLSWTMRGDLTGFLNRRTEAFEQAVRPALKRTAERTKNQFRAAGRGAGLGNLARAWAAKASDRGGTDIVYYVTPRGKGAIKALSAFTRPGGARVVPRRGRWLAVPLPAAGRLAGRIKNVGGAATNIARMDPQRFVAETGLSLEVARWRGRYYLVAVDARRNKAGRVRRALKRSLRAGTAINIPVFRLVAFATLHQRFDWRPLAAKAQAEIPRDVMREYERLARAAAAGERIA